MDDYSAIEIEQIRCILAQERTLTGAEERLISICSAFYHSEAEWDRYCKARRWGLVDGYNSQFRLPCLAGIINEKMPKKKLEVLECEYMTHYQFGIDLRMENDNAESSCD